MKRLSIIIAYVLLSFTAVVAGFSLMALTSSTAYAHEHDSDSDSDGDSRSINTSHPLKGDGEVRVDNLSGMVRIKAWDRNEVQVTGTLGSGVDRLDINGDESSLEIRVVLPHHNGDCGDCSADLIIQVPKASRVEVSTVSADVEARDVAGPQEMTTVSGNIILNSASGNIQVKSVSGDVQVVGSAKGARISASSVSGTLTVSDVDGSVDEENVSGDSRLVARRVTDLKLSATSGNLTFEGTLLKGGNYDINNVSGDVNLAVGNSPDARFDISSFSGDIDNSFGPKPTRVSKYSPGMELHFTSGNAGATLSARTLSGDIHLQN